MLRLYEKIHPNESAGLLPRHTNLRVARPGLVICIAGRSAGTQRPLQAIRSSRIPATHRQPVRRGTAGEGWSCSYERLLRGNRSNPRLRHRQTSISWTTQALL